MFSSSRKYKMNFVTCLISFAFVFVTIPVQADLDDDLAQPKPVESGKDGDSAVTGLKDLQTKPSPVTKPTSIAKPSDKSANSKEEVGQGSADSKKKPSTTKESSKESLTSGVDKRQPINWKAKGLMGDKNGKVIDLLDDVVVTQSNLKLEADKARVHFSENDKEVTRIVASGNVRVSRSSANENERMNARGREAVFDNKSQTITMIGDARLLRGADVVRGKQIIYFLESGMFRVEAVEGVVQPENASKLGSPAIGVKNEKK